MFGKWGKMKKQNYAIIRLKYILKTKNLEKKIEQKIMEFYFQHNSNLRILNDFVVAVGLAKRIKRSPRTPAPQPSKNISWSPLESCRPMREVK